MGLVMNGIKNILVVAVFILVTGCASVISGTKQKMTFKSDPEGAIVLVDGLEKGKTPLTIELRKDEYKNITFKKKGYEEKVIPLQTRMDPVAWLNIIWDLSTTDALTGALYEYQPSAHYVTLEKKVNRKNNNTYLDRKQDDELTTYVLMHYHEIRRQCPARSILEQCNNDQLKTLSWMVSRKYKKDHKVAKEHAIRALATSDDPVDYLKRLDTDIQTASQRIAVTKGNP